MGIFYIEKMGKRVPICHVPLVTDDTVLLLVNLIVVSMIRRTMIKNDNSSIGLQQLHQQNGLHLIMHRTIGLTSYTGPLTLTLAKVVRPLAR